VTKEIKNKLTKNMNEINKIICGNSIEVLKNYDDNFFDLTVFSPPYDNLRDYNGYDFDMNKLGQELFRVTKEGGIVVMVIQDQTIDGHKTLTSFKTIIDWCDNIGFGLFECNIYKKQGKDGAWFTKRFRVDHEYIPIFIKGKRPNYFNKESVKIPSKHGGKTLTGGANREKDGTTKKSQKFEINLLKCPGTIWDYSNGGDKNKIKRQHPATFPDKIPYDFIQVFTDKDAIILDPMVGSGSTCIAAKKLNRSYVGIDISEEYCEIANNRLKNNETSLVSIE
jgi:site-specific DNA-methyltransferase (adenine-specific)